MMARLVTVCALTVSCLTVAWGYPSGAPLSACDTLLPQHNTTAGNNSAFTLAVEPDKNQDLLVILSSTQEFKGFLISTKGNIAGSFSPVNNRSQVLQCPNRPAITHSDPEPKSSITVKWIPEGALTPVTFIATVVTKYHEQYATDINYSHTQ
ncbi:hypothetical protein OTU49_002255 [Cherax quadricarinatus]|uniref:Reelin domain-containing protein n=1 Tax=Cherax quadricarinatus TaxID=27406 RepID=A0AAW0YAK2_CHEQU